MVRDKEKPFGYIYKATNRKNGKVYIGQTVTSTWKKHQDPIKERWKKQIQDAKSRKRSGNTLRYIENAILKYAPDNFDLKQQDVANNQKELDKKEAHWIKEYDSTNPDKGYNMTEGGKGGRHTQEVREKMSNAQQKRWDNLELKELKSKQSKEYWNNPKHKKEASNKSNGYWQKPENKIAQSKRMKEILKNPIIKEKHKQSQKRRWENPKNIKAHSEKSKKVANTHEWKEKQRIAQTERWKDLKKREIQGQKVKEFYKKNPQAAKELGNKIHEYYEKNPQAARERGRKTSKYYQENPQALREKSEKNRKEISDLRDFITDIKNKETRKNLEQKYDISGPTINERIKEKFGPDGTKNYTELKNYLQNKDINEVLKEIEDKNAMKEAKDGHNQEITEGQTKVTKAEENIEKIGEKNGEYKEIPKGASEGKKEKEIEGDKIIKQNGELIKEGIANYEDNFEGIKGASEKYTQDFTGINKISDNIDNEFKGINDISFDKDKDLSGISNDKDKMDNDLTGISEVIDDKEKDFEGINKNPKIKANNQNDGEKESDDNGGDSLEDGVLTSKDPFTPELIKNADETPRFKREQFE